MKKQLLTTLLLLLCMLGLNARAYATLPTTSRPLPQAFSADGALCADGNGLSAARQLYLNTTLSGLPVHRLTSPTGNGDDKWQNGFGLPNGTNGQLFAVVRSGADIYIGGTFSIAGNVVANGIAKWNGTTWSALGTGSANGVSGGINGVSISITALAVASNGDVYAGGSFTQAGGIMANGIAKWNGTAWSALGTGSANGINGGVTALVVASNGDVYAGGSFTQAGGLAANNVAKWNGTAWSALGVGIGGVSSAPFGGSASVWSLAITGNNDLYVGGDFSLAGGVAAANVAKWNGTGWSTLGAGLLGGTQGVYALLVSSNGDVYAGGDFLKATTGPLTSANAVPYVARWNGTAWSPLGSGTVGSVRALAQASNGDVYVGGTFSLAGGGAAGAVAKWNGTAWSSLGVGTANGVSGVSAGKIVRGLAITSNGDLYAVGDFVQAGGIPASYAGRWNGLAWSTVGNGFGNGLNGRLTALATASNGDVYAGGYFTQAGGVAAYGVARWNGTVWSTLGIGTVIGNTSSSGIISLAVASNGDVYAGGNFTQIGGVAANNIARWNGTNWSSLGTGVSGGTGGAMATVYSLAIAANGTVYAGGNFTQAGGVAVSYIAQWSGTAWSPLGAGLNASANSYTSGANALAVASNGDVYAGGTFTQAGGVAAKGVAKWNGAVWSSLGTGATNGVTYVASYGTFDGVVSALKIAANGDIYLAGSFTHAGGIGANNVAKWNGTAWSSVGTSFSNGVSESVSDLVITGNGDVYVGGFLFLARWNGTAWSSLGTGVSIGGSTSLSARCSLAPGPASRVYVGGIFTTVGDGSKVMTHFGIYDPNAVLATAATLRVVPDALFPNPARGTATLRLPATALRLPIVLTDALGREVRRYPVPASSEAELDLRGLPAGTYVVRCGEVSQRLMIE